MCVGVRWCGGGWTGQWVSFHSCPMSHSHVITKRHDYQSNRNINIVIPFSTREWWVISEVIFWNVLSANEYSWHNPRNPINFMLLLFDAFLYPKNTNIMIWIMSGFLTLNNFAFIRESWYVFMAQSLPDLMFFISFTTPYAHPLPRVIGFWLWHVKHTEDRSAINNSHSWKYSL